MDLRDYLYDIPLRALKAIARSLDVTVEYQARIKLINAIDRAFWEGALVDRLLKRLSEDHRRLLSIIAFAFDTGVDEKALEKKTEKIPGLNQAKTRALLDDLIMLSLACGIRGEDNRFFCPHGIAEQVRNLFLQVTVTFSQDRSVIPRASYPNLLEDIFSFLALAYKQDIPLTLAGNIKKTVLDEAFAGSPTCTPSPVRLTEEFRNAFVIEYLKRSGLVVLTDRKVHTTGKLSGWLELSMTEHLQDILSFALTYVFQEEYAVLAFTGLLTEIPAGSSFDIHRLTSFLHSGTMASAGLSRLESRVRAILGILNNLGLIASEGTACVMTATGERFFHGELLPIDNNISGTFTMQPNFEVIVGPELDPRVRFKLELLTERMNRDMVTTYHITQEGIARARERGISTEDVIGFFTGHSRNPVPQNVRFSIETWAKAYGSIYFEDAMLMRFRDPAVCEGISHIPMIAPFVKNRIGDTAVKISRDHIHLITAHLKKAGYQPEVYGASLKDNATIGTKFIPANPGKILETPAMTSFTTEFVFPPHIMNNESSS